MAEIKDKYANVLQASVTTSAANTLTFEELKIGLSIFDKVGLLIHRILFEPNANYMTEMNAEGDRVFIGISQSSSISSITMAERACVMTQTKETILAGAGVSSHIEDYPWEKNYADMPGGGLLVAPTPLYLALNTVGYAGTLTMTMRLFFTIIKLRPEEYFELLESRQFFG